MFGVRGIMLSLTKRHVGRGRIVLPDVAGGGFCHLPIVLCLRRCCTFACDCRINLDHFSIILNITRSRSSTITGRSTLRFFVKWPSCFLWSARLSSWAELRSKPLFTPLARPEKPLFILWLVCYLVYYLKCIENCSKKTNAVAQYFYDLYSGY
ncbi:unknown protein [Desulfotalea psychrophila LSv54]|uniref:Uncharacterized protein n=1 Tax=Desulfotalea psychrophila (strain LSv54 / DSM 12343) TaxID=177439 RepID=Q6APC8_DESPS|nr:unknown protein [Desulfotalea psychrophila LSv54]